MKQKTIFLILFCVLLVANGYGQNQYTIESFNPYSAECQQSNVRCEVILGEVSSGGQIVIVVRKIELNVPNDPYPGCGYTAFFSVSLQGAVRLTNWRRYHPATYTLVCDHAKPYSEINMDAVNENFMLENADASVYTYNNGEISEFPKLYLPQCPLAVAILSLKREVTVT